MADKESNTNGSEAIPNCLVKRSSCQVRLRAETAISKCVGGLDFKGTLEKKMIGWTAIHDFDCSGCNFPEHLPIEQHEIDRVNGQSHHLFLAGIKGDASKSSELPDRKRDRSVLLVEIHLNSLRARSLARFDLAEHELTHRIFIACPDTQPRKSVVLNGS